MRTCDHVGLLFVGFESLPFQSSFNIIIQIYMHLTTKNFLSLKFVAIALGAQTSDIIQITLS